MFKNWTWKQWTALGIIAAVVIAAVVCHLVQPTVSYAWLEVVAVATFVLGIGTGCLLMGKHSIKTDQDKTNKQLLLD